MRDEDAPPESSPIPHPSSLAQGVALFNSAHFWHAHEAWEQIWLSAEGDVRQYVQGLIQLAAAYHHVQRGTLSGAIRLFDAALAKLEPFPLAHLGIDRTAAVEAARRDRQRLARGEPAGEFPRLAVAR
jgi:uncharacterized protein